MGIDAEYRQLVMALEIVRIPVLSDNYSWLVHDANSGTTMVIDPGEAAPVLHSAAARGWTIGAIWNTHWHPDHIGGNAGIKSETGARVTGPEAERARIDTLDDGVGEGDIVRLGDHAALVMTVPGHTQGHVAFHFASEKAIFTGDTLFAMGCGRLFEGSPADMYANMRRYEALDEATRVYCGHEYTLSNARYATVAEPDNAAVTARLSAVEAMRARGEATVPTTIGEERATNPFLRARSIAELADRRAAKDALRG